MNFRIIKQLYCWGHCRFTYVFRFQHYTGLEISKLLKFSSWSMLCKLIDHSETRLKPTQTFWPCHMVFYDGSQSHTYNPICRHCVKSKWPRHCPPRRTLELVLCIHLLVRPSVRPSVTLPQKWCVGICSHYTSAPPMVGVWHYTPAPPMVGVWRTSFQSFDTVCYIRHISHLQQTRCPRFFNMPRLQLSSSPQQCL